MTTTTASTSPTCTHCADWSHGYALGYAQGHAAGFSDGRLAGASEGSAHPAIVDSVKRMFGDWDGHEAAHQRSVIRFRDWYAASRQEVAVRERHAA